MKQADDDPLNFFCNEPIVTISSHGETVTKQVLVLLSELMEGRRILAKTAFSAENALFKIRDRRRPIPPYKDLNDAVTVGESVV